MTWILISGEYPPDRGGVSDYTRLLARGLVEAGDEVHVWTPHSSVDAPVEKGVDVHYLPDRFGLRSMSALRRAFRRMPPSCRVFVQHTPQAYGWKALNLPFCLWLGSWRRQSLWVLFHEVAYPLGWSQPLKINFLALVTRAMAALMARRAERVFISIPAWAEVLPRRKETHWLPVPSNIPTTVRPSEVERTRTRLLNNSACQLIGHFGTFGRGVSSLLREILPGLLVAFPERRAVLVGAGGIGFAKKLIDNHPSLRDRIIASDYLPDEEAAIHLASCDVLVQPYPDGATGRRSTLMAGLALGLPIVTTIGHLTESIWDESGAVAIAPVNSTDAFVREAEALLANPARRSAMRADALALYRCRFAVENTIQVLRACPTSGGLV